MSMLLSIVIPVYNAENCLLELYKRLILSLDPLTSDFEVILVDDRSPDNSWEKIKAISNKDQRIKSIRLSRNFGQHHAITAGLKFATGDWLIVMDCDLQDPPEYIKDLYQRALSGYDVVLARRKNRKYGMKKLITSNLFYKILSLLSGMKFSPEVGNYRIISKKVYQQLNNMDEDLRFFGGMVQWLGFSTSYVDILHSERFAGKSSYNYRKLFKLSLMFIIAYSDRPLYASIVLGLSLFFISLLIAIYSLFNYLSGYPPSGWTSLIVSIYMIGGFILLILGIIGIYIGKIFNQVKYRPTFVVDEKVNL